MSPPARRPSLPDDRPSDEVTPDIQGRHEDDMQYLCRIVQAVAMAQKVLGKNVKYLVETLDWALDDERISSPLAKFNRLYDASDVADPNKEDTVRISRHSLPGSHPPEGPKPWWSSLFHRDTILLVLVSLCVTALVFALLVLSYTKLTVNSEGVSGEQSKVVGESSPGKKKKEDKDPDKDQEHKP